MRPTAKRPFLAVLLGLVLALGAAACGDEQETAASNDLPDGITVSDAWVRATSGTEDPTMTAAFMIIANGTDADVRLVQASSPVSDMVQIHEMVMNDGAMVMQEAPDGVTVRAGKQQMLAPGGYHVMLMDLDQELAPGDEVDLSLAFSDGTTVQVTAPVKEYTEEEGHYHSPMPSGASHGPTASPTM